MTKQIRDYVLEARQMREAKERKNESLEDLIDSAIASAINPDEMYETFRYRIVPLLQKQKIKAADATKLFNKYCRRKLGRIFGKGSPFTDNDIIEELKMHKLESSQKNENLSVKEMIDEFDYGNIELRDLDDDQVEDLYYQMTREPMTRSKIRTNLNNAKSMREEIKKYLLKYHGIKTESSQKNEEYKVGDIVRVTSKSTFGYGNTGIIRAINGDKFTIDFNAPNSGTIKLSAKDITKESAQRNEADYAKDWELYRNGAKGSFMQHLAQAFQQADMKNAKKLYDAFPEVGKLFMLWKTNGQKDRI